MSKSVQSRAVVQASRRPLQFFKEVWLELHKVKWPTWHDIVQLTTIVLVTILAVGAYVALLDFVLGALFTKIGMYK